MSTVTRPRPSAAPPPLPQAPQAPPVIPRQVGHLPVQHRNIVMKGGIGVLSFLAIVVAIVVAILAADLLKGATSHRNFNTAIQGVLNK